VQNRVFRLNLAIGGDPDIIDARERLIEADARIEIARTVIITGPAAIGTVNDHGRVSLRTRRQVEIESTGPIGQLEVRRRGREAAATLANSLKGTDITARLKADIIGIGNEARLKHRRAVIG